jgi:hypothetical protein
MVSEARKTPKNRELSTQWRIGIVVALIGVLGTIIAALITSNSGSPTIQPPQVNVGTVEVSRSGNVELVRVSGDSENLGFVHSVVALISPSGSDRPPIASNETTPDKHGIWRATAHISPLPGSSGVSVQAGVVTGGGGGIQAPPCIGGSPLSDADKNLADPINFNTSKGSVELCFVSTRVTSH